MNPIKICEIVQNYNDIDLVNFIKNVPDSELNTHDCFGNTLLHFSCAFGRIVPTKFLIKRGANVEIQNLNGSTPLLAATYNYHNEIIKILCAVGVDLTKRNLSGKNAIENAILDISDTCIRVLIANGSRLKNLSQTAHECVAPWMVRFENGVLKCRSATIAMLALKRRGLFKNQCRFIIREIGIAIWATRCKW